MKPPAQRQREYKARKEEQGLKRVPNLWARPEHFEKIRQFVKSLENKAGEK